METKQLINHDCKESDLARHTIPRDPENGYYYHYKHDPSVDIYNYSYQVIGIGHYTEAKDFNQGTMVIYRPLYESAPVYKAGKHYDIRDLSMFIENVTIPCPKKEEKDKDVSCSEKDQKDINKNSSMKTVARFQIIKDEEIIKRLDERVRQMY